MILFELSIFAASDMAVMPLPILALTVFTSNLMAWESIPLLFNLSLIPCVGTPNVQPMLI